MHPLDAEYDLTFQPCDGYLHALVRCPHVTAPIAVRYLRRVSDKCTELNATRVLLERDIPNMLEGSDLFQTTAFFAELMRGRRVAFVNPHAEIADPMETAVDMGLHRRSSYRLFNNIPDAVEWLTCP